MGGRGQGGCERRSESFVKSQKQIFLGWWGASSLGVKVDVNGEVKFL